MISFYYEHKVQHLKQNKKHIGMGPQNKMTGKSEVKFGGGG